MALDPDNFRQILKCLLSLKNNIRTKAEEAFNSIPTETRVLHLLNSVTDENLDEAERQLACVLMRRLITNDFPEFYPKLSVDDQNQLKECLLQLVQTDTNDSLKKKMCDIVSELARNLVDEDGQNNWPEFLRFLFRCASSPSPQLKECSLRMFTNVPGVFGNQQNEYLGVIKQMLQQSLMDAASPKVRAQAVRAVCSFIIAHEKETAVQKHFQDLLPSMIQVLAENVHQKDDESILKSFIDLCESSPKFLRPQMDSITKLCLEVFSNVEVDDVRHMALEALITLCEVGPGMMKKELRTYIGPLVQLILKMMTEVEEDPTWSFADEIVDEDNENNNVIAESSIDRLACGLGGKIVLPHVISNIPAMLSNSDWRYRHAALMAISAVGEGCHKQMEPLLPQIIDGVLNYLQDEHPRVRYAACNAIGQMSSDFAPTLQKKFHQRIVPALLNLLDDNNNPRVQAHAGAALVNFAEDCPKHILVQHLDNVMLKLEAILKGKFNELLKNGTKLVLEQVVTTIASVADTAEEQFVTFYDRLMPHLKYIIENAPPELRQLRGKTLECFSLIGLAVGRGKFAEDAKYVMDILLKNYKDSGEESFADDDSYHTYLISAWARICIVLGKDFQPYLPLVIGPVMKMASMKPEVALFDNEDLEDLDRGGSDWQFISLGEQQNFGIRTAGLEDKVAACEMLVCYARELKDAFADYAEEVVRLMIPLLKFYFHDGVRTAAAQSLPHLLECVRIKGPDYVEDMWNFICAELLSAIKQDPENEVVGDLFHSLAKCIEVLGKGCLTEQWMNDLMALFEKNLLEHFLEQEAVSEKRKEEDYDETIDDDVDDNDEANTTYKISKLSDVVHALFKTYGTDFYPYFDVLLPHFVKMLDQRQKWTDHQWGLCIFDDLIEFTGSHSVKYKDHFLAPLTYYLNDKQPEVRQASCYGFGVLALYGGEEFAEICASVIPSLLKLINDPLARTEENEMVTENAISTIAKILKYNSSRINVDDILPHWLHSLPVLEDTDEVPHVYDYLCDLIERNHPIVLGINNTNLPNLIDIMTEVFMKDAIKVDHIVARRMITIIREIQKSPEVLQMCAARLTPAKQVKLNEILTAI